MTGRQRTRRSDGSSNGARDYRYDARRLNNPPAGLAPLYEVQERRTQQYAYDPHLDPQLVWAGKAEHTSFEVDVVPLYVHERISTKAILRAVQRPQPLQIDLFGETPLPADKQVQFYRHEVGWANRLILGDSLLVMNSLLVKEGMAGKVQMIYIDPPYGIKYASNFQPRIDRRDIKDSEEDLTREPEQIRAYRDTWKLGIHSYLTYLRDRLLLCRELLHESGSIFVQINDENLHFVRCLLDEVFGRENFVALIAFKKTGGFPSETLASVCDYLVWYAKEKGQIKYRQLYQLKSDVGTAVQYQYTDERGHLFQPTSLFSDGATASGAFAFTYQGRTFSPNSNSHWKTSLEGMERLKHAERLWLSRNSLRFIRYLDDFPVVPLVNMWDDTMGEREKLYAVQTNTKVVERCILMTTDPSDLVFDPTCGSGTTAWCAEKWGRRWITCDTSRVALAIARQRLMTAKFDYYELKDPERGPAGGFVYQTVPHVTLESIARNTKIDEIAARYQPEIEAALTLLNEALGTHWREWEVPRPVPHPVWPQEAQAAYWELRQFGTSLAPADQERAHHLLEVIYRKTGHRWALKELPEPVPGTDWPDNAKVAFELFWELKQKKRKEIDEVIKHDAPQETLYDRPRVVPGIVRVSGPFTVEAIPAPVVEDPSVSPSPLLETEEDEVRIDDVGGNYLDSLVSLLRQQGGVVFPGGKRLELQHVRRIDLRIIHAEAEALQDGQTIRVAISFGPRYGPIPVVQVDEAIPLARSNGYQLLLFAGFGFAPEVQARASVAKVPGLTIQFVHIAPDVLVGNLLKTNRASQIFTAFGQPDVKVEQRNDGTYVVTLRGVDIYDPVTGKVESASGNQVAAWFLDTDYDGATFHICQAFFPGDPNAWEKLQRALKATIDEEVFEQMRGTESFPFRVGEHRRVAVKVLDFRGNEVMRVVTLAR
jgi:adenine-specific DNA-methyltransferase